MPIVVCIDPVDQTRPPTVEIPGVGKLSALKSAIDRAPAPYDLANTLLGQAGPVTAPIIQVIRVVEVVLTIVDALKSVTNPLKLGRALKKIARTLSQLAALVPGVGQVRLARDLTDLVSTIIRGFATLIDRWIRELGQISNALNTQLLIPEDLELVDVIACSKERLIESTTASSLTLEDVSKLLDIVAILFDIVKFLLPGETAKDLIRTIELIATFPASIVSINEEIRDATDADAIADVVENMTELRDGLLVAADFLDSISTKVSIVIGGAQP